LDGQPSGLKPGDIITAQRVEDSYVIRGVVATVYGNGAFVGPVNEHNIRLLERPVWMVDDGDWRLTEVNGDPLF
jgi:hypothetical protein